MEGGNVIGLGNIGDYVANDGPNADTVTMSAGILANGEAATSVYLDHDPGGGDGLYISILVASIGKLLMRSQAAPR